VASGDSGRKSFRVQHVTSGTGDEADTDAAIEAFGKTEQVKSVFWTLFISMAGLVLARVVDPATAQQIVGLIRGMG